MTLGTFGTFEYEPEGQHFRRSLCSKRVIAGVTACFVGLVLLVTTLAITTLRRSSTLAAETGDVFTENVNNETTRSNLTNPGSIIYFTNLNGSIKAYSPGTSQVHTVVNGDDEHFVGMAYDSVTDKIYWSAELGNGTWSICRADRNGTRLDRTLLTAEYSRISELASDWITGNVYATTLHGVIFVCDLSRRGASPPCVTILTNQGKIQGIALDPIAGLMYYSSVDSIIRAEMDGRNRVPNFIPVNAPRGLAIDLVGPRLYMISAGDKEILTSDLEGGDIRTVVHLDERSYPQGITVLGERIYWTELLDGKLESIDKNGTDLQKVYDGADKILHLVVAPSENPRGNRTNDCDQQCGSSVICVLNAISFWCVDHSIDSSTPYNNIEYPVYEDEYSEIFNG